MAIALVAHTGAGSSAGSTVTTSGIDTTGANFLVMAVALSLNSTGGAVSDSYGNTWAKLTNQANGSTNVEIWYAKAATVGTGHTFTLTQTGALPSLCVAAFSGVNTSAPFDKETGSTGNSPGSLTPANANSLCITACAVAVTGGDPTTAGGTTAVLDTVGFTGNHCALALAYLIQTTAAAFNPGWNSGSSGRATKAAAFIASTAQNLTGTIALDATPAVTAAAQEAAVGSVTLTGTPAVAMAAQLAAVGSNTLTSTPAVTPTSQAAMRSPVTLTSTPAIAEIGNASVSGSVALSVAPAMASAGGTAVDADITLGGTVALAVAPTLSAVGSLSLSSTAAVLLAGSRSFFSSITLNVAPAMSAAGALSVIERPNVFRQDPAPGNPSPIRQGIYSGTPGVFRDPDDDAQPGVFRPVS